MIKVTRECFCDLCGVDSAKTYNTLARFTTEQTEGRIVTPYIETTKVELCDKCMNRVVILNARGAQGHNEFWINR